MWGSLWGVHAQLRFSTLYGHIETVHDNLCQEACLLLCEWQHCMCLHVSAYAHLNVKDL